MSEVHQDHSTGKRLKHVFGNPAHVWAHPLGKDGSGFEQTEAWNAQKNFFFKTISDGTRVLYSYRDSYPIASTFVHKKKRVYLVRSGSPYSVTTAGHMSQSRQAVPHNAIRFDVSDVAQWDGKPNAVTCKANLADIIERINEAIQEYTKAHSHSLRNITYARDKASGLISQAKQYAKLFNVKLPKLPVLPKLSSERRLKALAFDNTKTERQNKKNEAQQARWAEQRRLDALSEEQKIAAWRTGSPVRLYRPDGYALLRVKGNNVETSQGVTVPINGLTGAGRLLLFLIALKESKRTYQRNGHTERIGPFVVESFDCKVLIAGCHKIQWEEILNIASDVSRIFDATKP